MLDKKSVGGKIVNQEIINVNLYGGKGIFGGKESPLKASIIRCDKYEQCSYFKNNQCLNVRAPFSSRCKFGNVSNRKGYTSRAAKYYDFREEWKGHEKYGKLSYPPTKLGLIGDIVVFPYPHVRIREKENGELKIENPGFGSNVAFIEKDKFTTELIYDICKFRSTAMMGGEIKDYQIKTVPLFLSHLKEVFPDKYDELVGKYSTLSNKINYVGRKAFLQTINPSYVFYKSSNYPEFNEKWYWDGEILTYSSGYVKSFNVTKDYKILEIKIKPSDKSIITISSNEQASEETVFVD